ncbi:signal peptidase, endoplasmic reticulum-type [Sulfobacillus thermosulfidooxidans DSM 9293]|uniref:Signal peptidase I n=1 Tax=Sulfobacillus thermosulfidooxidans (strain DSM 9293 / VKM B-1269 / AT-1) TaxID=929705 RepID=A0A1W1WC19_SULTA|nr:signal peptidase I [Sulfobacillus thermosulfidooxidans]SMC03722.1 signal peptidase, endoplasmic reticulum-type [Sulfobacillus thermosulfidooxidans DSM 9293]
MQALDPSKLGPRQKLSNRHRRWRKLGTWSLVGVFLMIFAFFLVLDLGDMGVKSFPITYIVRSGSMAPAFNTGSLIVDTRFTSQMPLKPGEIVTFANPVQQGVLLTHQIVGIVHKNHKVFIKTKGEANKYPDAFLTPESNIVGVYHFAIPLLGYVIVFIKTRWLWLAEMVAGFVAIYVVLTKVIRPARKEIKS